MSDYTSFGLAGQVALVTGPTQGIGHTLALALAEAGCSLALVSRDRDALGNVAEEARAFGREAFAIPADLQRVADIQAAVEAAHGHFGRLDILVNNAAWTATTPALDVTEQEFDQTLDTSLKGAFFMCQAVARHMAKQHHGKIVNIGSTLAVTGFRGRSVYGAVKAGIHQLTRALATEWGPLGIHVNCLAPCVTETPTRTNLFSDPEYREWVLREKFVGGRWGQPQDHVGALLFLASPLSDMVMGHVLFVDGGWTIH